MSTDADRAALKARQGVGARYDAPEAPSETLLLARRGTAYFARVLNGLTDDELMVAERAGAVAETGYHARGLAEALARLRTGQPPDPPRAAKDAASLPARALRGLFQHSAVHLDVEWRDLPGAFWDVRVPYFAVEAFQTPLLRAEFVWRAAIRIGGRSRDLPAELR